jgi:hypothetical protein
MTASRDRALEALTRIITANGDADPGCTARECLVALEGLGYRPTEARPASDWRPRGTAAGPSEATRAELDAARRRMAVLNEAQRTAREAADSQDGAA